MERVAAVDLATEAARAESYDFRRAAEVDVLRRKVPVVWRRQTVLVLERPEADGLPPTSTTWRVTSSPSVTRNPEDRTARPQP
jgi:hypothetical protein